MGTSAYRNRKTTTINCLWSKTPVSSFPSEKLGGVVENCVTDKLPIVF